MPIDLSLLSYDSDISYDEPIFYDGTDGTVLEETVILRTLGRHSEPEKKKTQEPNTTDLIIDLQNCYIDNSLLVPRYHNLITYHGIEPSSGMIQLTRVQIAHRYQSGDVAVFDVSVDKDHGIREAKLNYSTIKRLEPSVTINAKSSNLLSQNNQQLDHEVEVTRIRVLSSITVDLLKSNRKLNKP